LALDSIAERYSVRQVHPVYSDKVLAEHGHPTLPFTHPERWNDPPTGASSPRPAANAKRRFAMKRLLIVLTLVIASAAPAMAEGFPNPYATHLGR